MQPKNQSVLHIAAIHQHYAVVNMLLAWGADPKVQDRVRIFVISQCLL